MRIYSGVIAMILLLVLTSDAVADPKLNTHFHFAQTDGTTSDDSLFSRGHRRRDCGHDVHDILFGGRACYLDMLR